jgi:hypothetical protein
MHPSVCVQCGRHSDGYRTYIGLQRGDFAARYVLNVCWSCFEVYITMAHSAASTWKRVEPGRQLTLPVASRT